MMDRAKARVAGSMASIGSRENHAALRLNDAGFPDVARADSKSAALVGKTVTTRNGSLHPPWKGSPGKAVKRSKEQTAMRAVLTITGHPICAFDRNKSRSGCHGSAGEA